MKKLFSMLLCGAMLVGFSACEELFHFDEQTDDSDTTILVTVTGTHNHHEYVDLGLLSGTLWATCNVGAESPEDYGDYFAWGETKPKTTYNWSNYKWGVYNELDYFYNEYGEIEYNDGMTKYNNTDDNNILDATDDAATANWGGDWRMPTEAEQDELLTECTWTWIKLNGVEGYRVIGKNKKSIFLPAGGRYIDESIFEDTTTSGYYWSSSLLENAPCIAVRFELDDHHYDWYRYGGFRCYGQSVRPVLSPR